MEITDTALANLPLMQIVLKCGFPEYGFRDIMDIFRIEYPKDAGLYRDTQRNIYQEAVIIKEIDYYDKPIPEQGLGIFRKAISLGFKREDIVIAYINPDYKQKKKSKDPLMLWDGGVAYYRLFIWED